MMIEITATLLNDLLSPQAVQRCRAESLLGLCSSSSIKTASTGTTGTANDSSNSNRNSNNSNIPLRCQAYIQYLQRQIMDPRGGSSSCHTSHYFSPVIPPTTTTTARLLLLNDDDDTRNDSTQHHHLQLVAVLLRRDLIQLVTLLPPVGGESSLSSSSTESEAVGMILPIYSLVDTMLTELLQLFRYLLQQHGGGASISSSISSSSSISNRTTTIRNAIGHCIAECCATLLLYHHHQYYYLLLCGVNHTSSSSLNSITTTNDELSETAVPVRILQRILQCCSDGGGGGGGGDNCTTTSTMTTTTTTTTTNPVAAATTSSVALSILTLWIALMDRAPRLFVAMSDDDNDHHHHRYHSTTTTTITPPTKYWYLSIVWNMVVVATTTTMDVDGVHRHYNRNNKNNDDAMAAAAAAVSVLWLELIVTLAMTIQQHQSPPPPPPAPSPIMHRNHNEQPTDHHHNNNNSNRFTMEIAAIGEQYIPSALLSQIILQSSSSSISTTTATVSVLKWQSLIQMACYETPDLLHHCAPQLLHDCQHQLIVFQQQQQQQQQQQPYSNKNTISDSSVLATVSVIASILMHVPYVKKQMVAVALNDNNNNNTTPAATTTTTTASTRPLLESILQVSLSTCWYFLLQQQHNQENDRPFAGHTNDDDDDDMESCAIVLEPVTFENFNNNNYVFDDDYDSNDQFLYALEIMSDLFRTIPIVSLSIMIPVLKNSTAVTTAVPTSGSSRSNNDIWREQQATLAVWQCIVDCIPMALGMEGLIHSVQVAISYVGTTGSSSRTSSPHIQYQAIQLLGSICECPVTVTPLSSSSNYQSGIDECFPYILQVLIHGISSPHTPVVVLACQTLISYCRPTFISEDDDASKNAGKQRRAVAEQQRNIRPYINHLFTALLQNSMMNDDHNNNNNNNEAMYVVQCRIMETIAYAIIPSIFDTSGGNDGDNCTVGSMKLLEPYYIHTMNICMSFATPLFDQSNPTAGSSIFVQRRAGTSIEVMTMIGQTLFCVNNCTDNYDSDSKYPLVMKQQFTNVAQKILQWIVPVLLSKNHEGESNLETTIHQQFISSCARIATIYASVIGNDINEVAATSIYQPYIQYIIPHIVQQITDPTTDIELSDGNMNDLQTSKSLTRSSDVDNENNTGTESMTVALPGRGLTKVTINTTKIQDKVFMIRALYTQIVALEELFGPYCSHTFDVMLPLVSFRYSNEIRSTSAQTVSAIFDVSCRYSSTTTNDWSIPKDILPKILCSLSMQIANEEHHIDIECIYALAESLQGCCATMFEFTKYDTDGKITLIGNLSYGDIETFIRNTVATLTSCLQRRSKIYQTLDDSSCSGDDERNEQLTQLQKEENLLTPLVDSIGYTLKCYGPKFTPLFKQHVVPILAPYCCNDERSNTDIRARLAAVCLLDDCVEYCGIDAATMISSMLLQSILFGINNTNHKDTELTRASIYGIAQIARHPSVAKHILSNHALHLIQQLFHRITITTKDQVSNDDDDTELAVFENSVSALASMILFDQAPFRSAFLEGVYNISSESVLYLFLTNLPLSVDRDEAMICHTGLCQMIENGTLPITSQNYNTVGQCVHNILESITAEFENLDDDHQPLIDRLRNIQGILQSPDYIASINKQANVVSPSSVTDQVHNY